MFGEQLYSDGLGLVVSTEDERLSQFFGINSGIVRSFSSEIDIISFFVCFGSLFSSSPTEYRKRTETISDISEIKEIKNNSL